MSLNQLFVFTHYTNLVTYVKSGTFVHFWRVWSPNWNYMSETRRTLFWQTWTASYWRNINCTKTNISRQKAALNFVHSWCYCGLFINGALYIMLLINELSVKLNSILFPLFSKNLTEVVIGSCDFNTCYSLFVRPNVPISLDTWRPAMTEWMCSSAV